MKTTCGLDTQRILCLFSQSKFSLNKQSNIQNNKNDKNVPEPKVDSDSTRLHNAFVEGPADNAGLSSSKIIYFLNVGTFGYPGE